MPELKQLSDFYDPTKAGMAALNVMQSQQHMAIQQQQAAAQGRNMEIDNLQKALKSANPMDAWPIQDKLSNLLGVPSTPVNKYLANQGMYNNLLAAKPGTPEHDKAAAEFAGTTPESQKIMMDLNSNSRSRVGASNLLGAAKLPNDPNSAELAMNNPSILKEATNALAQSPKQVEEARRLAMSNDEHEGVVAAFKAHAEPLMAASKNIELKMQRVMPYLEKLKGVDDEYVKDLDRYGSIKAAGKRIEAMKANPELQQMDDARKAQIPELKKSLAGLENKQAELEVRAQAIAMGARQAGEGESLHLLTGEVDKNFLDIESQRALLKFHESPTSFNREALGAVKAKIDAHVQTLNGKKLGSEQSLNIRRAGLDEKIFMDQHKIQQESNEGKAQADWLEDGAKVSDLPRIARQYGVSPEKIRDAAKDPNRILTQVTIGQEKAESQTVGKGLGEDYLDTQKASKNAAGMLGKLDRMDALLSGVTTGKLTPNMTEIQSLGEALGLKVDKSLGAKQAFTALSAEMALQLRNPAGGAGMPGAMSDKDREFLQSMTPSLAQTNEGNKLIIETARKVAQREQQIAKMARSYRQKHGHMDEGFADEVQAYGEANPLFKGKSLPTSGQAPSSAFNDAEKERRYQEYKRKNAK